MRAGRYKQDLGGTGNPETKFLLGLKPVGFVFAA
jgi:hypothetical protein